MDYTFTQFGAAFDASIGEFAKLASASVAAHVAKPVQLALSVWILAMGLLYMNGLTKMTFREIVFQVCKIALISMVALQTPAYAAYMIEILGRLDGFFISMLPHTAGAPAPTNVWDSVSLLWSGSWDLVTRMMNLKVGFSLTAFFESMVIIILACLVGIGVVFMTSMGLSLIVVNKVILVILLGFGPLFLCFLMFNVTRGLFGGWMRTICSTICTFVLFAAAVVFAMVAIDPIVGKIEGLSAESTDGLIPRLLELAGVFLVICFSFASLFRWIPMVSRNITGAIAGGAGTGMVGTGAAVTAAGLGGAAFGAGVGALAAKGVSQAGSAAAGAWGVASAMAESNRGVRAAMAANMGPVGTGGTERSINTFLGRDEPIASSGGSTPPSSSPGGSGAAVAAPTLSDTGGNADAGVSFAEGGGTDSPKTETEDAEMSGEGKVNPLGSSNGVLPIRRDSEPYGASVTTNAASGESFLAGADKSAGPSGAPGFTEDLDRGSTTSLGNGPVSLTDIGNGVLLASRSLSAGGGTSPLSETEVSEILSAVEKSSTLSETEYNAARTAAATASTFTGDEYEKAKDAAEAPNKLSDGEAGKAVKGVAAANRADDELRYRDALSRRPAPTMHDGSGSAGNAYRDALLDRAGRELLRRGENGAYLKGAVADTIHRTNAEASSLSKQARDVKSAAWSRFAAMTPNAARFAASYGTAKAKRTAREAQAYENAVRSGRVAAGYAPGTLAGSFKTVQGALERASAAARGRTVAGAGSGFMMGYALGADRSEYGDFEDDGGDGD